MVVMRRLRAQERKAYGIDYKGNIEFWDVKSWISEWKLILHDHFRGWELSRKMRKVFSERSPVASRIQRVSGVKSMLKSIAYRLEVFVVDV